MSNNICKGSLIKRCTRILTSCDTIEQLDIAWRYIELAREAARLSYDDFVILIRTRFTHSMGLRRRGAMAREGDSSINYDNIRKLRRRDRASYFWDPTIQRPRDYGLNDNCSACPHVVLPDLKCPYVQTPKTKKFPCYFRQHVLPKISNAS